MVINYFHFQTRMKMLYAVIPVCHWRSHAKMLLFLTKNKYAIKPPPRRATVSGCRAAPRTFLAQSGRWPFSRTPCSIQLSGTDTQMGDPCPSSTVLEFLIASGRGPFVAQSALITVNHKLGICIHATFRRIRKPHKITYPNQIRTPHSHQLLSCNLPKCHNNKYK